MRLSGLLFLLLCVLAAPAWATTVKFSAFSSATYNTSTDFAVGWRSGSPNTNIYFPLGAACTEALGGAIIDDGAGNLTIGAGDVTNTMLAHSSMTLAGHSVSLGGTQAFACSDLSNGATGCSTATGTSGATIPLLNGNNTFSGTDTFSAAHSLTATTLPTQAAGTLGVAGEAAKPALAANGEADLYITSTTGGITLIGKGSTNDFTLFNSGGTSACTIATGTTTLNCVGLQENGTAVSTQTFGTLTNGDWCTTNGTSISCNTASPAVTWPTSGDVLISNGGNSPTGVAEVDNDCLVGTSGSWAAGSCSTGSGTVTSVATGAGLTGGTIITTGTIAMTTNSLTRNFGAGFDGGGSALTAGKVVYVANVPCTGTITGVQMIADQSGSAVVDVWVNTYTGGVPTVANTITASDLPTLSSAQKYKDTTLTGWTTSLTSGDLVAFKLNSASTVTELSIVISETCT